MKPEPKKELSLFDSTCLILGIIIGAGIYQVAPDVAQGSSTVAGVMALWVAGGLLSLCGALGYAELATAYPGAGGDYIYLGRAYGRWAGFLFGWVQLSVVRPGDIAVMAFVFATYARTLYDPLGTALGSHTTVILACGATLVLTAVNILGVREGKWTQNILTIIKILGLLAIVFVAFVVPPRPVAASHASKPLSLALILVLFTFGGWNEMAYVAAEVKNPKKNIVRAIVSGTVSVTIIYLLVNAAFLFALGKEGMAGSRSVAADAVSGFLPRISAPFISALVCISALGAANGLIFAGARISYAMGSDHRTFGLLGRWSKKTSTPAWALAVQGLISITIIWALGSFVKTVIYTAGAVYLFYLASNLAVIVLRRKEPLVERPYKVTGYPFTTLLFCGVCAFLVYSAVVYKPLICLVSFAIMLLGLPLYAFGRKSTRAE